MIDRTFAEFGKLDILVNNAAFQNTHDSLEEFTTEEFDRTFKTNVYAMFWLCRAALPRMKPAASSSTPHRSRPTTRAPTCSRTRRQKARS